MSQTLNDQFVLEAGEYLDELAQRLRASAVPDSERIHQLARGVRGSAQLAQAEVTAGIAARLEGAARFLLEGRIPWSPEVHERMERTVDDLQRLVPAVAQGWGPDEADLADRALARWGGFEEVVDAGPPPPPRGDAVFSFVRAELAGVVEALDAAIARLRDAPDADAPPREVLERIRVVRGVSASEPLAPVLEVVDGVDELARALVTESLPAEGERLEMLVAARDALRGAHRSLEQGEDPAPKRAALDHFRELRRRLVAGTNDADPAVVPISALFYDDAGPHIVSLPGATAPDAPAVPRPPGAPDEAGDGDAVPIETLLLRGDRALEEALALRGEVDRLVEAGGRRAALRERMAELWDLVELGRAGKGR